MAARLGDVIYWLGCGLAAIFGAMFLYLVYEAVVAKPGKASDMVILAGYPFVFGLVCFLVGRAARYILGGR